MPPGISRIPPSPLTQLYCLLKTQSYSQHTFTLDKIAAVANSMKCPSNVCETKKDSVDESGDKKEQPKDMPADQFKEIHSDESNKKR